MKTADELAQLEYHPTKKKALFRRLLDSAAEDMPPMTYRIHGGPHDIEVETWVSGQRESTNVAQPGDVIMSGPASEQYVVKGPKFPKLYAAAEYDGVAGVVPDQSMREVARYTGDSTTFMAPWGEVTVLHPGDYVVREAADKFYRVAKEVFDNDYDPID